MCTSALPLCLLLWTLTSRTQGEVFAVPDVVAEASHPLTIGCNITKAAGATLHQVRWLHKHKKILAYKQSGSFQISHQDPNVQLTTHDNNASYITIRKVQPGHEGCYHCMFDVFPTGQEENKTCIKVIDKVHQEANKTAIGGKSVTLSCWYSRPESVVQVLWRKIAEQGDTTLMASYNKKGHYNVHHPFKERVGLSRTLDNSQLTIQPVRTEDEACYTCEFHTYPEGKKSSTTCLSVYVLPKPEVTTVTSPSGVTEANCTAQSRPAAEITWNVGGDNRTLGPPISSENPQGDGTTIVTSTLLYQSGLLNDLYVKCIVRHRGLEKPLSVPLYKNMGPAMVILLSVCGVAAVLLLCLCVCLCKCFVCTDD